MAKNIDIKRQYVYQYLLHHPCVDCGEMDPLVLEFDHLNDKRYTISRAIKGKCSLNDLVMEIKKCQVRCANCHRRKTTKDLGSYRLDYSKSMADGTMEIQPMEPTSSRKLNMTLALEIRSKYVKGVYGYDRLAKEYGVCDKTIREILRGDLYK